MNGPRAQHLSGLRCADADNSFGPAGLVCRFDFTLLFEESILFIGPSSLFLLLATLRIWQLRKERVKVRPTLLRILKVVSDTD
jgi:ATP-binding cassette, subfamily C (CFTR/MRP), member 1